MLSNSSQPCIEHLIAAQRGPLLKYAKQLYRDVNAAEDAVHRTICLALESLQCFDGQHLSAWLHKILLNDFRSERKKKRPQYTDDARYADHLSANWGDPEYSLLVQEVLDALPRLHPTLSDVLLHSALGCSLEELSRMTGASANVVKQRVFRGRKQLKVLVGGLN